MFLQKIVKDPLVSVPDQEVVDTLERKGVGSTSYSARSAAVGSGRCRAPGRQQASQRSEEHTSELQSLAYLVCRLLLEKKKHTLKGRRSSQQHNSALGTALALMPQ